MDASEPIARQAHAGSAADALLAALHRHGVDFFFANAGTDFPPLIEGFARAARLGAKVPRPILVPHENAAVAMAHGVYMVSGRPQAVMVHVNVGTGNAINTLINASRDNVPVLLMAGRSPVTEAGHRGSRTRFIHWAQEMFDQAGMVREFVKWDYELRNADQVETVVDRALGLARSEPAGPVYLTLPREVLAAETPADPSPRPTRQAAATAAQADTLALERAATLLAVADNPLIITTSAGRDPAAVAALAALAEAHAIPVVQCSPRHISLPSDHPMHLGYDSEPLVPDADVILVLESDVPWIPSRVSPRPDAKVIQLGLDPLFARYPIRGFEADLAITGSAGPALHVLARLRDTRGDPARVDRRRRRIAAQRSALHEEWRQQRDNVRGAAPIHPAWVSHCIGAIKGPDAIVVDEYPLLLEQCGFDRAGSFYGSSAASGLGWGFGAALGAKLAAPDRPVIATLGDGAYLFSNPVACHHAARLHDLPILIVVFNNAMWNAVRRATFTIYPDGGAVKSNDPALCRLEQLPPFEKICEAAGGYGERVEDPAVLEAALLRASCVVRQERRQALVNVVCQATSGPL